MEPNLQALLDDIRELEKSVTEQLKESASKVAYEVKNRRVTFGKDLAHEHRKLRRSLRRSVFDSPIMMIVTAPVIYSLIVPIVLLDLGISLFQHVCFPVYGIPTVIRKEYVSLDRHRLKYLNAIEKINCEYCAYFNGIVAYTREIASRTEQYFCPIRHALRTKGLHSRHGKFTAYGDAATYQSRFLELRKEVRSTKLDA